MSNIMSVFDRKMVTEIKGLHHPDGREIDAKTLLQTVKDIFLLANEKTKTSKVVPPLPWSKSLLVPLEEMMRDISTGTNRHTVAVSLLQELSTHVWGAKAALLLTCFAMNHGLWMLAQMYSGNSTSLEVKDHDRLHTVLSRTLSEGSELDTYYIYLSMILSFGKKPKENQLPKPALTNLFKVLVEVVECIIELEDLPSADLQGNVEQYENTMADIPIIVYRVITIIIYCAVVINQLPNNDYEISEAEGTELSLYASKINQIVKELSNTIKECKQFLEETKYDKEYQLPISETSNMNNRKALEYLIKSGGDRRLQALDDSDTIISQLEGKYVMVLVSDEDCSMADYEIFLLQDVYGEMQLGRKEQFSILWIPLYSGLGSERLYQQLKIQMMSLHWYASHPSMISKEATEFIKKKWRFQGKSNILVMLDPQGNVLNINVIHMILIWGIQGFPFNRSKERALWKSKTFNMDFILDGIDPIAMAWIQENKYVLLYSGDDIGWVRKFTRIARQVSVKFGIPMELLYVGKPSKGVNKIKTIIQTENLSYMFTDEMQTWLFWSRLRSMLISKMSHQQRLESEDLMTRQLKWLLGYETERSWALLGKGRAVVTHGPGSTIMQALMEYDTKKTDEYGGSFDDGFGKLHKKVVSSMRVCCQVEFHVSTLGMPETMKCPQPDCNVEMMERNIVFQCCHPKKNRSFE